MKKRREMYSVDLTSAILTEGWVQSLSVLFSSVTQSCPTLCDPMDCSRPGFPVHHQLPELAQTHVYQVGDAIQPPHPLLPPSPLALNLSQHQSKWIQSTFKKPNFSKKYTNGTVLWSCVYRWVNFHKLNTPRGRHPDWATEHLPAC